jgi:hypothetical protein
VKQRQTDDVLDWLLEGDPAIRWQVCRDLTGSADRSVRREREHVARAGWGAQLLSLQDRQGTWGGGLYTPKWTSTTYTLLLLRDFGLPPDNEQARKACRLLLDKGLRADNGVSYGSERSETCITGMILSLLSYFRYDDERVDAIAGHLLEQQMPDGGWNCRRWRGDTHASVHTTISALEGLRLYELHRPRRAAPVRVAQERGREFLLVHRLFRSHRTGNVIKPEFTRLAFPPRWHYDILRALDHFQAAGAPPDARASEAVGIVRERQAPDGRWPLEYSYAGETFFGLERPGKPSRWNTLRAMRVLKWWDAQRPLPSRSSKAR